ncbi:MAG: flavin-containing monooxygenase [Woeseiaceae bacterium]
MSRDGLISARIAGITDVIVIGAGHAGLATSYLLTQERVAHVVLERGEVANAWRERSWDSLKLLTPNWQTQLPGFEYTGDNPFGFMDMDELVALLEDYAAQAEVPVHTNTNVTSVRKDGTTYRVSTNHGEWRAKAVVLASGACNIPTVPKVASDVPAHIKQLTPLDYCSPQQLEAGGVLIVGASATGMQFADEISKAGLDVTIATGEHVRMPRRYRGRDILDWMDRCGILGESYDEIEDLARGRRLPSSQLVGSNDKDILDLNSLRAQGVRIAGRLMGINNGTAQFSGSLRNVCALADLKMNRLLGAIDNFVVDQTDVPPAESYANTQVDESPLLMADLDRDDIKTIIWATGFRPDYSWLDMPVLDRKGNIQHDGGVVAAAGLYVLGLPLMRARKSSFIFGINDDAKYITSHLTNYLRTQTRNKSNVVYQNDSGRAGYRRSA